MPETPNLTLVWIDSSTNNDEQLTEQFYDLVDDFNLFHDVPTALKYLQMIYREQVLVIVSTSVEAEVIDEIHQLTYVNVIFLLQSSSSKSSWAKVKLIHGDTKLVYPLFAQTVRSIREQDTSISFFQLSDISSTTDLHQLEPSFMYTKLFKKTLLDIQYDSKSRQPFIEHWRQSSGHIAAQSKLIDEFEREYLPEKAIWWYTRCSFIYETLNQALRDLNSDTIVMMAFFLHDLHRHLQELYVAEVQQEPNSSSTIYRGQGLSMIDFEKLNKTQGGLISFNNFLSTSDDREVSLTLAESASFRENMVGILFVMTIDQKIETTPFVDIRNFSWFPQENETLFSMHAVFRIGEVKNLNPDGKLFEVKLTLTDADDPDLRMLSDCIEKELSSAKGWHRVADLLIRLGRTKQVEDFYQSCLAQASKDDKWIYFYYGQLARVKYEQGAHREAIKYYEQAIAISEKMFLPTDHHLSQLYNNISTVFSQMGEHDKAKLYLEKDISIAEKHSPSNYSSLGTSYNNMSNLYLLTGDYSTALAYLHKALSIFEKILLHNHPNLALSYLNMGTAYHKMGDHSKQLFYMQKAVSIYEKVLPSEHPTLASCYNNIGMAFDHVGESTKSLIYLKKAITIFEKTLPANHPTLATAYSNIGTLCIQVGDNETALDYIAKAISIEENADPPNQTLLATYYNNMGMLYGKSREYYQALTCYENALSILQNISPPSLNSLATCYNNIGSTYHVMGQAADGLPYLEKALEIREKFLPLNHFSLAWPFNNLAMTYNKTENYSKALIYSKKAMSIIKTVLPKKHPLLITSYNNMGSIYHGMKQYSEAMDCFEKALSIVQSNSPIDQYQLAVSYSNIAENYFQQNEYHQALPFYQKAVDICLQSATDMNLNVNRMLRRIEEIEILLK